MKREVKAAIYGFGMGVTALDIAFLVVTLLGGQDAFFANFISIGVALGFLVMVTLEIRSERSNHSGQPYSMTGAIEEEETA